MTPILLLALGCTKTSDIATPPPSPPVDACAVSEAWQDATIPQEILSAFEAGLQDSSADGVVFAILIDGEIRYAGALGERDADNALPMEPDTLLRNGSNLKMQTAAALVAQAARGDISLQDTLADHLPDFSMAAQPGVAEPTTLHQLLSHQGGFYDYTPIDGPNDENSLYEHAHDVFAANYWVMVPPGSLWNYSNPNFSLAGLAAQEASGRPYASVMDEDIWTPLCMDRTFVTAEDVLADGRYATATSNDWEGGLSMRRVEPDSYDHGFSKPAGFGWTTTMDMLRFADFLMAGNDTLAPNGEHLEITERHVDTHIVPGGSLQYGYGMFIWDRFETDDGWKQAELWEHGGDIPGFAADLWILSEHNLAIAVLANGDGAHFSSALGATVNHLVELEDAPAPSEDFDLGQLDEMAGTYDDPWNVGRLVLTRDADTLSVVAEQLDEFEVPYGTTMTPLYGSTVLWEVQGTQIALDFLAGPSSASHFIRHRAFVAERTTDRSATGPTPSRAALDRLSKKLREPHRL